MAFFSPGDKVTVRADLSVGIGYSSSGDVKPNCCNATPDMLKYAGKQMTIRRSFQSRLHNIRYHITEDNGDWAWADEMFEEYLDAVHPVDIELPTIEEFTSFILTR